MKPRLSSSILLCLLGFWVAGSSWAGPYADKARPAEARPALDRSTEVAGPDLDGNGIRDDIDAWLTHSYEDAVERVAMQRAAAALQDTLKASIEDAVAVRAAADRNARAVACLWAFADSPRLALPQAALAELERLTINTPQRMAVYRAYAGRIGRSLPPATCSPEPGQSSR